MAQIQCFVTISSQQPSAEAVDSWVNSGFSTEVTSPSMSVARDLPGQGKIRVNLGSGRQV